MTSLGRTVLLAMAPLNLLLLLWIWIGRLFFGAGGWLMVFGLYVLPFVAAALLVTTVLGFVNAGRPRALTPAQARVQLAQWAAMLGFGFFLVDFGDTDDSVRSVFTQLAGRSDAMISVSWTLTAVCGVAMVAAWVVLLVLLVAQRRRPPAAD